MKGRNKKNKERCGGNMCNLMTCKDLARNSLVVLGAIADDGNILFDYCCDRPPGGFPRVKFKGDIDQFIDDFFKLRMELLAQGNGGSQCKFGCNKCIKYKDYDASSVLPLISFVNLSIYPSPCQSKCIYCELDRFRDTAELREKYETIFDIIEQMKIRGYIMKDARFQVSCGEISIHPYRKRVYEITAGSAVGWYSNCFKYDEMIAANLSENSGSFLNLSIDSGTPETWCRIKGFENFDKMKHNLKKYGANAIKSEQILLKYILLPEINDGEDDYIGCINLMNELDLKYLDVSRDYRKTYVIDEKYKTQLISSAKRFAGILKDNGIEPRFNQWSPEEIRRIME